MPVFLEDVVTSTDTLHLPAETPKGSEDRIRRVAAQPTQPGTPASPFRLQENAAPLPVAARAGPFASMSIHVYHMLMKSVGVAELRTRLS